MFQPLNKDTKLLENTTKLFPSQKSSSSLVTIQNVALISSQPLQKGSKPFEKTSSFFFARRFQNAAYQGAALNFCYSLFQRPAVAQKLVVFHSQKAVSNVCLT